MEDLSLHILDLVQNSVRAEAKLIEIALAGDRAEDLLTLEIRDDGKGMDSETCARAADPFFTTKPDRRIGMGLAMLAQAAKEAEGDFQVASRPGAGTLVTASFRWSHPDCKPLGDIAETLETLVTAHRGIDFVYEQREGEEVARFDTREIRKTWSA